MIEPFTAKVPEEDLAGLQCRLADTRWAPEQPAGTKDGTYGVPLTRLRRLVARWQEFDWRSWENRLNAYPQFLTRIDGQPVHFLHVRSALPGALPVVLSHGWPGSVFEYSPSTRRRARPESRSGWRPRKTVTSARSAASPSVTTPGSPLGNSCRG